MKARLGFFALTLAVAALSASVTRASTITAEFKFFNSSDVVASGSFSYDSSKSGPLEFGDLTAFSISGMGISFGNSYGLADVQGAGLGALTSYNYFGYDTTLNSFVPKAVDGPQGPIGLIFSAVFQTVVPSGDGVNDIVTTLRGFQFDPLTTQADPVGNQGNDGLYAFYDPKNCGACDGPGDYPSFTSFSVTAIPEPSTWVMMLLGFSGLGFVAYRRKARTLFEIA